MRSWLSSSLTDSKLLSRSATTDATSFEARLQPRLEPRIANRLTLALLLAVGAVGCSDDGPARSGGQEAGPLYAIMYEVYDDAGSSSYLSLLDSLDAEAIDLAQAREYGRGRAFVQAYNGWLFIGEAETPTVTRYSMAADGELEDPKAISFANFGLQQGQFDSWNATFLNPEKAYLLDTNDGKTIIWNPSTMEILGEIPPHADLYREGLSLETTPAAVRDGLLFRTFSWVNYEEASYSTDFFLAIYDTATDELLELVEETRCPVPGNLVHQDEAGVIYFSNWIWPVAATILRDAPEPCVLRINPGQNRFDPDWVFDYTEVTGGHRGAMFSYLQNNQALVSAFYDERTSFDETTDPWSYVGSMNWRIWNVDIESKTGAPLDGLDFNGGAFTPARFEDRQFLMVPGGEEQKYATQIYEVVDGRAEASFELPGWSYQFVKVR